MSRKAVKILEALMRKIIEKTYIVSYQRYLTHHIITIAHLLLEITRSFL